MYRGLNFFMNNLDILMWKIRSFNPPKDMMLLSGRYQISSLLIVLILLKGSYSIVLDPSMGSEQV